MLRGRAAVGLAIALMVTVSCGGRSTPTSPAGPGSGSGLTGFRLEGDPATAAGATWTYQATVSGVAYDLQGVLFKPVGSGPFPGVIVSHGAGGNANGYSRSVCRVMVGWDVVCIATNYTHAGGAPPGSPGGLVEPGASAANVRRARALVDILGALGYVSLSRIAAHGHSMGAFVTAATASAHPDAFRVASHTAGGVRPDSIPGTAPSESQVGNVRAPYQMHHGDADRVVALSADQRFAAVLAAHGQVYELIVYPGADHDDVAMNPVVFERVRSWYARHGLFF